MGKQSMGAMSFWYLTPENRRNSGIFSTIQCQVDYQLVLNGVFLGVAN